MNFIQRLKYFIYGVLLGLILVFFLLKNKIKSSSNLYFLKKNNIFELSKLN